MKVDKLFVEYIWNTFVESDDQYAPDSSVG